MDGAGLEHGRDLAERCRDRTSAIGMRVADDAVDLLAVHHRHEAGREGVRGIRLWSPGRSHGACTSLNIDAGNASRGRTEPTQRRALRSLSCWSAGQAPDGAIVSRSTNSLSAMPNKRPCDGRGQEKGERRAEGDEETDADHGRLLTSNGRGSPAPAAFGSAAGPAIRFVVDVWDGRVRRWPRIRRQVVILV